MKRLTYVLLATLLMALSGFAQSTSILFFSGNAGGLSDSVTYSSWGFAQNRLHLAEQQGYTPGTDALLWATSNWSWQGINFGLKRKQNLKATWNSDTLSFKIKAPAGINTLLSKIKDNAGKAGVYIFTGLDTLSKGDWLQVKVPLKNFVLETPFDTTQVQNLTFEAAYENKTIPETLLFDDIQIGSPKVVVHVVVFNGRSLQYGISYNAWGFPNNNLVIAQGEGYVPGTNAINWEGSNWSWQGMEFKMRPQDFTNSWPADTLKFKIKAPAGINSLLVRWKDANGKNATRILTSSDVVYDGTWKKVNVPLNYFTPDAGFNMSKITAFRIEAAVENLTVPQRLLFTDIWTGNPSIDVIPPAAPASVSVSTDPSYPYVNLVSWADVTSETGETYNVYASLYPITKLDTNTVVQIAANVPEGTTSIPHRLYYPLKDHAISYYYAVETVDKAGNVSTTFAATPAPYTNVGKKRAVISLNPPQNFIADANLNEWTNIVPYTMNPKRNIYSGIISDSLDYSAEVYVAIDSAFLYVAFDVLDDVFSWRSTNTQQWWEDENIEFYFGLYQLSRPHQVFQRGKEPDYRIVFIPNRLMRSTPGYPDLDIYQNNTANYIWKDFGGRDYIIEAKIALSNIRVSDDAIFKPKRGIEIPFEIFAADADVVNGGNQSYLQLGDNPALNPFHGGPSKWTFAWIGVPDWVTGVEKTDNSIPTMFEVMQNYPNPFNPSSTIRFAIPHQSLVTIKIYNMLGQEVKTLMNKEMSPGLYNVQWDGKDNHGQSAVSGVYVYRVVAGQYSQSMKMLLLK
ncbi:MAG: T9SS type A sorting domain-containing protein [Bacteroidetes bacterium]|nr:T9SS type A sorting domain-containing protein [Bacteroidota bacterium]MBU2584325.1 T9SS type A sorting domain-containing protein [Bacteroidota bacterium]